MAKHYSVEEKIDILSFLDKGWGITEVAQYHSLSTSTVKRWRHQYQLKGIGGLKQRKYTHFSQEFKQKVVLEDLSTDTSLPFLRDKYNISNESVIYQWVKLYTSGNKLEATRRSEMNKGRSTTLKERIEITNWVIAHDYDYSGAMRKFTVSYGQVYSWTKKLKKYGPDGLIDRRGKGKSENDLLTTAEKQALEVKRLKEQVTYLSTENNLLKKLQEIERRDSKRTNIVQLKNYHRK